MKEKLFKAAMAGVLLTGCASEAKDTPVVPTPREQVATLTPEIGTITPEAEATALALEATATSIVLTFTLTHTPTNTPVFFPTKTRIVTAIPFRKRPR